MAPYPAGQRLIDRELQAFQRKLRNTMPENLPKDVMRFIIYVHEMLFMSSLNVSTAMDACGIRSNRFYVRFRRAFGMAPHDYIESRRIEAAIRLMTFPELSLQDIADAVGYDIYDTFLRAFEHRTREAPSVFRGRNRG